MTPSLQEIDQLAREAGELLKDGIRSDIWVASKGTSIDLVTEMDHKVEAFILGWLSENYPEHRVIAEETGVSGANIGQSWYIDPLDGTVNYAHGLPIYAVSIAYAEQGVVRLAAVFDPSQGESFTARKGAGAWVNGIPIRASRAEKLADALLVTGFPYDSWTTPDNNLENYHRFTLRTQGVRRLGSAALDLCYVAAGRLDGYWELSLSPWDIAAGALIAAEAGAKVTGVNGEPLDLEEKPSILAANAGLHSEMLALLRAAD